MPTDPMTIRTTEMTDRLLAVAALAYVSLAGVAGLILAAACLVSGPHLLSPALSSALMVCLNLNT